MLLLIIILPSLKVSGYQLFSLESSLKEKIHPKTKAIGFRVLFIYLGLTLAEIILLYLGDMNLFDSICHSFSTVATGGFSTKNNSLMFYSSYSQYVVMIFMFLAGTSQVIYYYLVKLNFKKVRQNEELWFYILVYLDCRCSCYHDPAYKFYQELLRNHSGKAFFRLSQLLPAQDLLQLIILSGRPQVFC